MADPMKTHKLRVLTFLLVFGSLFFAIKAVGIKKNAELLRNQVTAKSSAPTAKPAPDVKPEFMAADVIGTKQVLEGLIAKGSLPLDVVIQKTDFVIKPRSGADSTASKSSNDSSAADHAKHELLTKYQELLQFLSDVAVFGQLTAQKSAYTLTYKSLCIGVDCPTGFEMTLGFAPK